MNIRFEYRYNMEFCFRTHSEITIKGLGIWDVDEESFAYEFSNNYSNEEETFEEYCLRYLYEELLEDLNDDSIKFNLDDLKLLENYCNDETDRN